MNDTIAPQVPTLRFTAARGVYQFGPAVTVADIEDQLSAKQSQLNAMLSVAGESRLDCLHGCLANYFWACRATAEEIEDLTAELLRRKAQPAASNVVSIGNRTA